MTPEKAFNSIGDLDKPEPHVFFFRLSCALGFAVEKHQASLAATSSDEPLIDILMLRSRSWADEHVKRLSGLNYSNHIRFVRAKILSELVGLSPLAAGVFRAIADSLCMASPTKLTSRLQKMADGVHGDVTQGLSMFGGNRAQTHWESCPKAVLTFRNRDRRLTSCSFDRGPRDVITIHIGDHQNSDKDGQKGALRTYYNLKFFFFHEYLSHSFSLWQNYDFAEGYLFWAERQMFNRINLDKTRNLVLEDTFSHRLRESARYAEDVANWFQVASDGRFLKFLLEWAAEPSAHDEVALAALFKLSETYSANRKAAKTIPRIFLSGQPLEIRETLKRLAREAAGTPKFIFRLP